MTIEYTWAVSSVKTKTVNGVENAIVQTYWTKTGTDENGNTGTFSGATPFRADQVDPNNFTPFSELTESQILTWIKAVVVNDYEKHVNDQILRQIEASDPVDTPLPWVQTANTDTVTANTDTVTA